MPIGQIRFAHDFSLALISLGSAWFFCLALATGFGAFAVWRGFLLTLKHFACSGKRNRQDATVRGPSLEEKYRSFFENAIEGIFQTTPPGEYLSANPRLAKIYGYDSPQALLNGL